MTYVLEAWDEATGCIAHRWILEEVDDELGYRLTAQDLPYQAHLDLSNEEAARIQRKLGLMLRADQRLTLRKKLRLDDLPYEVHTGRELSLMLKKAKPLAVFSDAHPNLSCVGAIPESYFDPYVKDGKFVKAERIDPAAARGTPGVRRVFYALPEEAWRIQAYNLMLDAAARSGWCEALERIEGALLGYREDETDAYLDLMRK